jgi:uncharacterized protein YfkK (UPF0435 family)
MHNSGGTVMNCIDAQRHIMPFINKKLVSNQLEDFLNHVNNCPNCMEELEVYYVLFSGMKQLDEDKELSNNFHQDLLDLLKQSEDKIFHDKLLHIRKKIILIVLIAAVSIISSFQIGELVVEDVLENQVTESNFLIDNVFQMDKKINLNKPYQLDGEDRLDSRISENLPDIYEYIKEKDPVSAEKIQEEFGDRIWKDIRLKDKVLLKPVIPTVK